CTYQGSSAAALLFDAAQGWRSAASPATPRYAHSATLLPDGGVLICGGHDFFGGLLASCERLDPAAAFWRPTASLAQPVADHGAVALADGALVVGGRISTEVEIPLDTARVERYDATADVWRRAAELSRPRSRIAVVGFGDGRVVGAGGMDGRELLGDVALYDPAEDAWTAQGALPSPTDWPTAHRLEDGSVALVSISGVSWLGPDGSRTETRFDFDRIGFA